jgi:dienelactone hydrolase
MSSKLALFPFAVCASACYAHGEPLDMRDGGEADIASSKDTRAVNDVDGAMADTATTDIDGDDPSSIDAPFDASVRDASDEATSRDAPLADGSRSDAPLSDATGDPIAPRFPRTAKYTIVIPRAADAGAGSGDAGARDLADVYYPDPPDLHSASYAFSIVLLLQGAKVARGFYGGVAAAVAGYGFIVVVPDHISSNVNGAGLYAELSEIAAASAQMKIEAASTTAPVRGVVDTKRIALMGHSYGGASGVSGMANMCFPPALLCTFQRPAEVVGGAFYGTNLAAPIFGVPALDTGGLPVLLVQGSRDAKALPADAQRTYEQLQKRPKAIISLLGANHYSITDVDNPAGADPEVNAPTLDQAQGVASSGRWIGLFFAAFLNGDSAARDALRAAPSFDRHVTITLAE